MGFLVVVGVLQFAYCVVAGNYVSLGLFAFPCAVLLVSERDGCGEVAKHVAWLRLVVATES